MSSEEIKDILTENTPLYGVLADLIVEYTQPIKFKVGDILCDNIGQPMFVIIKRNRKSFRVRYFNRDRKYKLGDKKAVEKEPRLLLNYNSADDILRNSQWNENLTRLNE